MVKLKDLTTEEFDDEGKQVINPEFYTDAVSDGIKYALKVCIDAACQSGLKIIKVSMDEEEGRELLALQAEDAESSVLVNVIDHLKECEFDLELGSHQRNHNIVFVVNEVEIEE